MTTMQAAVLDGQSLRFVRDHAKPNPRPGWALIRVGLAGICKTDLEITKGYKGFRGIPGHEFVGRVESCADPDWIGRRVVGEINAACGHCHWCDRGLGRHCPERTTLGINRLDGCMAEYCLLPIANLLEVPAALSDEQAVLTGPLAAACEILEQVPLSGAERVMVLGDGRLGILCAWALATRCRDLTLIGHHPAKLATAAWRDIRTCLSSSELPTGTADLVVEASGSPGGLADAMRLCRARGTIVLKSTLARPGEIDLTPLVINEQTLIGSRCGRFADALTMMRTVEDLPLERLISDRLPLSRVAEAFARAGDGTAIKVLLDPSR